MWRVSSFVSRIASLLLAVGAICVGLAVAKVFGRGRIRATTRAAMKAAIESTEGAGSLFYQFVHGKGEGETSREQDGDEVGSGPQSLAEAMALDACTKGLKDSPGCTISLYRATGDTFLESNASKVDVVLASDGWLAKASAGKPSLGVGVFRLGRWIFLECRQGNFHLSAIGNVLNMEAKCRRVPLVLLKAVGMKEVLATVGNQDAVWQSFVLGM